ncbi:GNAT family N-acetyltransferase [Mitsuaria sp. GD03876]|uniref:GNAT family N-acetyltransferase n=1 Tax=Mitsuaria sp. GD03876 TaxID=2975399 RepID=UPI0024490101|nr:GNAT family N-acetyltransferase [Mitsuaria sp. GD03876]MDH0867863.1 GNAT family N-acetyltransferase [Mitsuaria sp. GD03876]
MSPIQTQRMANLTLQTPRLVITPLVEADLPLLAPVLWDERVYAHIGGLPDDAGVIALGLQRALAGPPADRPSERWLNYGMRLHGSESLIGRLEATVHDGIAEVAFLLGPTHWGHGYAAEGLAWLHDELARLHPEAECWATTLPANARSSRLLTRCGYLPVDPALAPALMTYDDGDLVFRLPAAPRG